MNATVRMEINDHSWVHIQIVTNIALKLLRQLTKHGVEPSLVRDFGMTQDDAEIVVTLGALLHCVGMAVHREGHEDFSLFLAEPKMRELLDGLYEEPELTVIASEVLQAITSHRDYGKPLTLEAGIVRVADALDMAKGRSRIPFEHGRVSIHSLSAAAIEDVTITDGDERPVKIEILMNNSSGIYQVDGLLKAKLQGLGPGAVRRGDRAHRHRGREAARADLQARNLAGAEPALEIAPVDDAEHEDDAIFVDHVEHHAVVADAEPVNESRTPRIDLTRFPVRRPGLVEVSRETLRDPHVCASATGLELLVGSIRGDRSRTS